MQLRQRMGKERSSVTAQAQVENDQLMSFVDVVALSTVTQCQVYLLSSQPVLHT